MRDAIDSKDKLYRLSGSYRRQLAEDVEQKQALAEWYRNHPNGRRFEVWGFWIAILIISLCWLLKGCESFHTHPAIHVAQRSLR